jgi:protein-tyrosine phosphatase
MPPDYTEILPRRLWVGSFVRPDDVARLRDLGITTIISLQSDDDLRNYFISFEELLNACFDAGIELRRIPIQDFDRDALAWNLPRCVRELEAALARPSARVYLHCTAGKNRAPTAAAAYLIRAQGIPPPEALEYLRARRQCQPYRSVLEDYAATLDPGSGGLEGQGPQAIPDQTEGE